MGPEQLFDDNGFVAWGSRDEERHQPQQSFYRSFIV